MAYLHGVANDIEENEGTSRPDGVASVDHENEEDRLAEMAAFGASEAACIHYPGEHQQPERAAYCAGAADGVRAIHRHQTDDVRYSPVPALTAAPSESVGDWVRIDRQAYPEIIQAVRWSDDDNGTGHFEPGVGFIVDDPDGLSVPSRWMPHIPTIEAALAGLDHAAPHPLDVDVIEWLTANGREPTILESAAYSFVCGEHTPVTAMAKSSPELWAANRFLNEYFEGWTFDPAAGFEPLTAAPKSGEVGELREARVKALVDRFLAWPLPETVCADLCAADPHYSLPRSGTNLLNAVEAEQMIRHLIGDQQ